jgi:hypothetical protein
MPPSPFYATDILKDEIMKENNAIHDDVEVHVNAPSYFAKTNDAYFKKCEGLFLYLFTLTSHARSSSS